MYPPPEVRTSNAELLGTTTGIILTAVVGILGLAALLAMVFLAEGLPPTMRMKMRRRGRASGSGHAGELLLGRATGPGNRSKTGTFPKGATRMASPHPGCS